MRANTKKIILSLFVILGVVGYAVYQRFGFVFEDDDDRVPKLTLPSNTTANNQTQNSNSGMMSNSPQSGMMGRPYKDGEYTGESVDAFYGNVQVVAVVRGGRIIDVKFLDYPKDRSTSLEISNQAMPLLKTEAIVAQKANVDIISGATQTSEGFIKSLASALAKAK